MNLTSPRGHPYMFSECQVEPSRNHAEASTVIWRWRPEQRLPEGPSANSMRLKGLVQAIVAGAVAGLFYWWQHVIVATIVASIGTLLLLLALTSPLGAFAAIERAMARFGQWVGVVVGWLVLLPLFYLFFLPFGSLFRRGENDRLKRFYQAASDTYWVERIAADDPVASRQRQF